MPRHSWGALRKLPSGRWQASYVVAGKRYTAPTTFSAKRDADAWLARRRTEIDAGDWLPPNLRAQIPELATFGEYAEAWLEHRALRPRTREHYRWLLQTRILPTFGQTPWRALTAAQVRRWYAETDAGTETTRAHAYGLMRTVCRSAVDDELIPMNPCRVRGGGQVRRKSKTSVLTPTELARLADAMPDRFRPMVLLAGWCGLRFGELAALTADDLDLDLGTVTVDKAVYRLRGRPSLGDPKSDAGTRTVAIPPHIIEQLRALPTNGLLFAGTRGGYLQPSTFYRHYHRARVEIGRPDLRFHDLRHTGLTLAAIAGATLADLMSRAGHSTASAALRYQHAAQGRDATLAEALSRLAAE